MYVVINTVARDVRLQYETNKTKNLRFTALFWFSLPWCLFLLAITPSELHFGAGMLYRVSLSFTVARQLWPLGHWSGIA